MCPLTTCLSLLVKETRTNCGCKIVELRLDIHKQIKFSFVEDEPAKYSVHQVEQYSIDLIIGNISNSENHITYTLRIFFKRDPINQILKVFIPTLLLSFIGLSTLVIDMDRFNERFMGAATMILVQATWLNIVSSELPKTSYVKLIDIWFVWHISISFAIILCHIAMDKIKLKSNKSSIKEVGPCVQGESDVLRRTSFMGSVEDTVRRKLDDVLVEIRSTFGQNKITKINLGLIIIFTVSSCIFYAVYFLLTYLHLAKRQT